MKNQIILEYLEQLDLSDIEAKLYLTLLETGPISVRELATKIDIKRTTAYLPIEQLIDKGLIIKVVKGANKLVAANDPKDSLDHLVQKKLHSANTLEQEFPNMINLISTSLPQIKEVGDAEIKFYKGKNGVMKIYEDVLKAKEIRSYVNLEKISENFPNNFQLFDDVVKHNPELKMYEIVEDTSLSRKRLDSSKQNNKSFYYKFMPKDMKLTAQDILIYDGKVGIINLTDKINGVVLHNSDFYNNLKLLFDFMWKILP